MKKLLLATLLASAMGNAQTSIYTESFEDITDLQTAGWTLYNDTNTPYGTYASLFTNAWEIVSWGGESGNKVATSPSWFTVVAPADRWLVSPAITIPTNHSATLEFFARSHDTSPFDDGFKLKISTTNTAKTSFSNILSVDHAVDAPMADQTPYQVDLSAYSGKTVFLAWVNDYTNGNLLSIDDIDVSTTLLAVNDADKRNWTIYPNPTADFFTIDSAKDVTGVKIYDFSGKVVKSLSTLVDNKVDVSNLENGIYTVSIETKSGTLSKKMIKK
ncbi:MAG: T9SS type A sorting domain-containing protein [Weeksellaceae bacterium]|nr:T9SS type A sorting domain-containing protein [Weeksellaceae bacterium]